MAWVYYKIPTDKQMEFFILAKAACKAIIGIEFADLEEMRTYYIRRCVALDLTDMIESPTTGGFFKAGIYNFRDGSVLNVESFVEDIEINGALFKQVVRRFTWVTNAGHDVATTDLQSEQFMHVVNRFAFGNIFGQQIPSFQDRRDYSAGIAVSGFSSGLAPFPVLGNARRKEGIDFRNYDEYLELVARRDTLLPNGVLVAKNVSSYAFHIGYLVFISGSVVKLNGQGSYEWIINNK